LAGTEPLSVTPMRDRDLFDFLGFDLMRAATGAARPRATQRPDKSNDSMPSTSYQERRGQIEAYFDRTAAEPGSA
jgi:hypothetical protein